MRQPDGKAQRRALHQLAEAAFEDAGDEQHEDAADRHLRGLAAVQRQIFDAGIAAGKQDLVGDHEAAGAQAE